jgi:hypothetical protein
MRQYRSQVHTQIIITKQEIPSLLPLYKSEISPKPTKRKKGKENWEERNRGKCEK